MTLRSIISMPPSTIIEKNHNHTRSQHASRSILAKKKYKIILTKHPLRPYSFMLVTIEKEKHGDYVADITFFSSTTSSDSDSDFTKDIESIKESELADVIKKYRVFVECIKTAEQKELSRTSKNAFQRIDVRSIIQRLAHGVNPRFMKKTMITNGTYVKNATLNTVKIRRIISEFNELKNNSLKRDIHSTINVGGTPVVTRSTIELDADIVCVIQKQPEVRNLTIRNFILNIHMSNVSLSTFFLLNKVNGIFSNCGMIIGFSRMATMPVSIYNLLFISLDPFSIMGVALPTGLFIVIPRIARLIIKYRIRKRLSFFK